MGIKDIYDQYGKLTQLKIGTQEVMNIDYQVGGNPNVVTTLTDKCGNSTTLALNSGTKSSTITDKRDNETSIAYYDEGTISSMTNAQNDTKKFYPDSEHASVQYNGIYACNGQDAIQESFYYDESRNPLRIVDPNEEEIVCTYNDMNKPTQITDREGNSKTYAYSQDKSLLYSVTNAEGKTITYNYDQNKILTSTVTSYKTGVNAETTYTHDLNGYIDIVTSPEGIETDYDYDDIGRLVKVTDHLGRETIYTYDDSNKVTKIEAKSGAYTKEILLTYDNLDNITSITDPDENTMNYVYDECGVLQYIEDPLESTTEFEFDEEGNIVSITDARENTSTAIYDDLGRIVSITDPLNKTTTYQYDERGRLFMVTDPLSNVTEISYDNLNRVTEIIDPLENDFSFSYNKEGYMTSLTDSKDYSYYLEYNDAYQVTKLTNPKNAETTYEYYPFGGVKKVTNELEQYVTYDYDSDFRPIKVQDWGGRYTEYTYDNANRVTQVEDHTGRITSFTFDGFGNMLTSVDPLENETTYEYDISNNLTAVVTPLGKRYEYYYDALDRVIMTKDPLGHERNYTYDEVSNLIEFENPLENITKWAYDQRDQLEKATDPLENDYLYTYDDLGRLTNTSDPLEREMSFAYNDLSLLTTVTDPLSNVTSYSYDDNSNLTGKVRPATSVTGQQSMSYTFDELDRLTRVTSPLGYETDYAYNAISMVTGVTFPDESTASFTYDNLNRLTTTTLSDSNTVTMAYDTLDRVTTLTDSIHGSISFTYDLLSRITEEEDPYDYSTSYTYDDDSRLTSKTTELGTTSFTYDDASRLTDISAPDDLDYSIVYDIGDRVNNEQLPNTVKINSLYDADDRPTSIVYTIDEQESMGKRIRERDDPLSFNIDESKDPSNDPLVLNTAFDKVRRRNINNGNNNNNPYSLPPYSDLSLLLLSYSLANASLKLKTMRDGGFTKSSYNEYIRINNDFKKKLLTESEILGVSYTYDAVSNITAEEIEIGLNQYDYTYTYDDYDQLITAVNPEGTYSYTYDQRNNRLTQRTQIGQSDITEYYTYDLEDRLTNMTVKDTQTQNVIREIDYTYNYNGDLIEKEITEGQNIDTFTYSYFVGGNLKDVTLPDETTVEFTYYAGGLRASKTSDTEIISYHYSGGLLSKEVYIDKVTEDTIRTIYYLPYGFKIIEGENEDIYFYVSDMRGSVIALTDITGAIVETYSYDPFGKLLSNQTIFNNKLYIGTSDVMYDNETDLYYMHARYYDTEAGRFIQKDSVEGALGNPISQNLYTYCANDPINKVDPAGTTPQNTGMPARYNNSNIVMKVAGTDRSVCILTDLQLDIDMDPELIESPRIENMGNDVWDAEDNAMGVFDCSHIISDKKVGFIHIVVVEVNGHKIRVIQFGNGKPTAVADDTSNDDANAIAEGMNDAFDDIYNAGGSFLDLGSALNDISQFYSDYGETFGWQVWKEKKMSYEHLRDFIRDATVGRAIAEYVTDTPVGDPRGGTEGGVHFNSYNMIIGFWTSFYNRTTNMGMKFFGTGNGAPGMVDFANLIKAMISTENSDWEPSTSPSGKKGLMQIGSSEVDGISDMLRKLTGNKDASVPGKYEEWHKIPFWNICAGIGHLIGKMAGILGMKDPHNPNFGNITPKWETWYTAVQAYGPHYDNEKPTDHADIVWKFLTKYLAQTKEKISERKRKQK